ncbi:MAG: o-succinylbenzoate synthase [Prevotella sp.]|uniref:o-succinylbenzoate synthase n=1 Tax=Prevotella sp. P5-92 TaxID=2024222 RepID=UPI000B95E660|nr:o-succinylbenzoate synthase [Prevotella sp. P5-92]MDD6818998.1 o-succinylbenzoate synthase [Prevotella sp.]MDY4654135.1 o-succinylbenzoate synthase [Prevotella sp.]OYP59540.1 o-succinylbenzoate synthase [Prevotella sp. P5-92]
MYSIKITPRTFHFQHPAGTSRGIYTERKSWMLEMTNDDLPGRKGIGECAPLPELSCDDIPEYEKTLRAVCDRFEQEGAIDYPMMRPYPSMLFGLETALLNLQSGSDILFDNDFSRGKVGITINGLVWMGDYDTMLRRIEEKLQQGFHCIKLKIGAIEFEKELDMVKRIRERFSHHEVQLRVDANGGFTFDEALYKLELLAQYAIHSIEQPIKAKQWGYMAELCRESPLPIALDEELIGINIPEMKAHVLNIIKPAYIVLKPSLHGGMKGVREWVDIANRQGIRSWITSALESNVGLNAVAQLAADIYGTSGIMPQGLGTGQLFTDNIPMRLEVKGEKLYIKR